MTLVMTSHKTNWNLLNAYFPHHTIKMLYTYSNGTADFKDDFGIQLLELPSERFIESIMVFPKIHIIEGSKYHIILVSNFIN